MFNADEYNSLAKKMYGMDKRSDMYELFSQNEDVCRRLHDEILQRVFDGKYNMAYQPHINKDGICTGAEALFRMNIDGTFINPMLAFALAGYYGEENRMTIATLDRVCGDTIDLIDKVEPNFVTTFNVDPDIFCDFCDSYKDCLTRHGLSPQSIAVEVTEGSIIDDKVREKMKQLHLDGTNILIDDFGQGESREIDDYAQYYKIPKETVDNIENDEFKKLKFIATCTMLKRHGKKIVVEGVETAGQNEIVKNYADSVQGYYHSKPLLKDDFLCKYAKAQASVIE